MTKRDPQRTFLADAPKKVNEKKHKNQEELTTKGTIHGNADGLSRRPPIDEASAIIRTITEGISVQVRETLQQSQAEYKEMGDFVRLRLNPEEPPSNEDLTAESETTKRLVTKWKEFRVCDGLVYRETESPKKEN